MTFGIKLVVFMQYYQKTDFSHNFYFLASEFYHQLHVLMAINISATFELFTAFHCSLQGTDRQTYGWTNRDYNV